MEAGPSASIDVKDFIECFQSLAQKSPQSQIFRRKEWNAADPNNNGCISLSECDGWIQQTLISTHGTERGDVLWRAFRPCYIRAFNRAKIVGPTTTRGIVGGTAAASVMSTDDYVTKTEFRLLNAYLCVYANMLDAFAVIDGGGAAREGVESNTDRRISKEEWDASYDKVSQHGFVALSNISDPEEVFSAMDADGKGMVLFGEWCEYLIKAEVDAQTPLGELLSIVDTRSTKKQARKVVQVREPPATETYKTQRRKSSQLRSSRLSTKVQPGSGASIEAHDFVNCFLRLAQKNLRARLSRHREWNSVDPNGNGLISLSEFDRWIKYRLISKQDKVAGGALWRLFRPCYIHAFNKAKNIAPTSALAGAASATTDDYVSKKEFRLLNAYLCLYANMYDAFAMIDGVGLAGVDANINSDRRISLEEWITGYQKVSNHGFVALSDVTTTNPESIFSAMDADGKGMVLLGEWCEFLAKAEVQAQTPLGELLSIANKKTKHHGTKDTARIRSASIARASRLSVKAEPGVGTSVDAKEFIDCFAPLGDENSKARKARRREWNAVDPNGNGLVSLSECDRWIKHTLISKCGNARGSYLWRHFRPCYIRAFNKAKDVAPLSSLIGAHATTDDFVTKKEFRLLNAYLCIFANMFDAFGVIDTGGIVDAREDHRITLEEWLVGYTKVSKHGFVALSNIGDPEAVFSEMDGDGKGMVLLGEWCYFLAEAEVHAKTPMGDILSIADKEHELRDTKEIARKTNASVVRASRYSVKTEPGLGTSEDAKEFIDCFVTLGDQNSQARQARRREWNSIDPNGNGLVSLSEFDRWIKHSLVSNCGYDRGSSLWRHFRPCYIHAFNKAKDLAPLSTVVGANATTDDFVAKKEFRLLNAYLCIYVNMFDAFSAIDVGSNGVDGWEDRRISMEEWIVGHQRVSRHGFVALADIRDPRAIFTAMDADGKGMILLGEWCAYLSQAEVDGKTPMGELLMIALSKPEPHKKSRRARRSASSLDPGKCISFDVAEFVDCFVTLGQDSRQARKLRRSEWNLADPNGNSLVSLAEYDRWIKHKLVSKYGYERGDALWRRFRPCYIHTFNKAKDVAPSNTVVGANATTDDYVSKKEFRMLNAYLCIYANMLDAFTVLDTGSAGVDAGQDRRISKEKWIAGYKKVSRHGFVALSNVSDPEALFLAMDADGKGTVLLGEWCTFLAKAEVDGKTTIGELLLIAESRPKSDKKAKAPRRRKSLIEPTEGSSSDVKDFMDCFEILGDESSQAQKLRRREWSAADLNGNGLISLSECDRWIKQTLISKWGKERGDTLWRFFRPCYIHAFNSAKSVAPQNAVVGANATTDDYVSKREFRLLNTYLCIYAKMFDAFAAVDGGSYGVGTNEDRRISMQEWKAGYPRVSKHGFVAISNIDDPEAAFLSMDVDGQGMVLLGEWCNFLAKAERDAKTPIGQLLMKAPIPTG